MHGRLLEAKPDGYEHARHTCLQELEKLRVAVLQLIEHLPAAALAMEVGVEDVAHEVPVKDLLQELGPLTFIDCAAIRLGNPGLAINLAIIVGDCVRAEVIAIEEGIDAGLAEFSAFNLTVDGRIRPEDAIAVSRLGLGEGLIVGRLLGIVRGKDFLVTLLLPGGDVGRQHLALHGHVQCQVMQFSADDTYRNEIHFAIEYREILTVVVG